MRVVAAVLASLVLVALMMNGVLGGQSLPEQPAEASVQVEKTHEVIIPATLDTSGGGVDPESAWYIEQDRQEAAWYAEVKASMEREWYAGVQRALDEEAARQAAAAAAQRSTVSTGTSYSSGGTTVGACTGFAIPDYIIQRESGGNPSAMNPSGAYGCAQTLLSHYSSGSCRGLDPYTIEGQRECVNILSGGGTNLAPWAQTR